MKSAVCVSRILLACFAISACVAGAQPAKRDRVANEEVGPVSVAGARNINLGEIRPYGITNLSFRLLNASDNPVKIERLLSTCSCISGIIDKNEIPPKGELKVTLSLNTAKVDGTFERVVWVRFADPPIRPIKLSLSGVTGQLFSGIPEKALDVIGTKPNIPVTNHFTFTALSTNATLGIPALDHEDSVTITYTLSTNLTDTLVYSLETVLTVKEIRDRVLQYAKITFPVNVTDGTANPLELFFKVIKANNNLRAIPGQISLDQKASSNQTAHLIFSSSTESLAYEKLTWDPLPDGVTLAVSNVERRRRKVNLAVAVTVTPSAALDLLRDEMDPQTLRFHYPKHTETAVNVVRSGTLSAKDSSRSTPFNRRFLPAAPALAD